MNSIAECRRNSRSLQILVKRFPADAIVPGNFRFLLTFTDAPTNFSNLLIGQGPFAATIGTALLGQSNPLGLTFTDQGQ